MDQNIWYFPRELHMDWIRWKHLMRSLSTSNTSCRNIIYFGYFGPNWNCKWSFKYKITINQNIRIRVHLQAIIRFGETIDWLLCSAAIAVEIVHVKSKISAILVVLEMWNFVNLTWVNSAVVVIFLFLLLLCSL